MGDIESFKSAAQVPRDLKPGLLYVDAPHFTVLIPYNATGGFVPFHVSTIRAVATSTEGQWTILRFNFHIPTGGQTMQFPASKDPNNFFVKELTLKNQATKVGGENHLIKAAAEIKELIKKQKDLETHVASSKHEAI